MLHKEQIRGTERVPLNQYTNVFPRLRDSLSTEDDPAEDDEEEGNEDLEGFAPSGKKAEMFFAVCVCIGGDLVGVFAILAEENERQKEESMVCAPGDESPIGSMPKAGEEENNEGISYNNPFFVTLGVLYMGWDFRT